MTVKRHTISSVGRENGRNVSVAELNERRVAAVRMRVDGATIDQTAAETGLSRPTVINAFKAYRAGGWEAVPVRGGALAVRGQAPRREPATEPATKAGRAAATASRPVAVRPPCV